MTQFRTVSSLNFPVLLTISLFSLSLLFPTAVDCGRLLRPAFRPVSYVLGRRQSGYHPELGSCHPGFECSDACGPSFQECPANTGLALFCYDPSAGQTCCGDGFGRACDTGYYCARGYSATWCCLDTLTLEDCASLNGISGTLEATSKFPPPISPSHPQKKTTTTTTTTDTATTTLLLPTTATLLLPTTIFTGNTTPLPSTAEDYVTTTLCSTVATPSQTLISTFFIDIAPHNLTLPSNHSNNSELWISSTTEGTGTNTVVPAVVTAAASVLTSGLVLPLLALAIAPVLHLV